MNEHPSGKAWKLMVGSGKVAGGSSWRKVLRDFRGPWEKRSLRELYDRPQQHPIRLREIAKDARAVVEKAMRDQHRDYMARRAELLDQLAVIDRFVVEIDFCVARDKRRKYDDGGEALYAEALVNYTLEDA